MWATYNRQRWEWHIWLKESTSLKNQYQKSLRSFVVEFQCWLVQSIEPTILKIISQLKISCTINSYIEVVGEWFQISIELSVTFLQAFSVEADIS